MYPEVFCGEVRRWAGVMMSRGHAGESRSTTEFEHNPRSGRASFSGSFHLLPSGPCGGVCKKFNFAVPTAACLLPRPPAYIFPIPLASGLLFSQNSIALCLSFSVPTLKSFG